MNSTSYKHNLLVLGLMTVITLVMTWPLSQNPASTVNDFGDPLLNSWILWWDVRALFTPGLSLFNAPIFHPAPLTLAYSEHLLVSALSVWPLLLGGGDAVLAHNLVLWLSFIMGGFGAYLLGYELTGSRTAALVAGLGFGFAPFRFGHLGHLQILTSHFMPFVLLYLHRWAKDPRWPLALAWGFFWLLQVLSCGYHALFISLAVGLFLFYFGWREGWWRSPRRWLQAGTVGLGLLLLVVPFYLPYQEVKKEMGFKRSLSQAANFAARPEHYLAAPPANLLYGKLTAGFRGPEGELFLGATLTLLVLVGLAGRIKGPAPPSGHQFTGSTTRGYGTREQLFYLILAILAFWASLGPEYGLYRLLYYLVPGFEAIRVPARLAVLVTLAWALLAAWGVKYLQDRMTLRSRLGRWLAPGLALLILLESCSLPIPWMRIWTQTPEVYEWLARQPRGTVIMELPALGHLGDHSRDARYLYWSTKHGQTLVNGYSGFFPPDYLHLANKAKTLPAPDALKELQKRRVRYLVLHLKEYPRAQARKLLTQCESSPQLKKVYSSTWDHVFELAPQGE